MARKSGSKKYKVIGSAVNESNVEVIVTAGSPKEAQAAAAQKDPALGRMKEVSVYEQSGWKRVL